MHKSSQSRGGREEGAEMEGWSKEQDGYLASLVELYGPREWQIISDCMSSKYPSWKQSAKECKERWKDFINVTKGKQSWTDVDRFTLINSHRLCQNSWSTIAAAMKKGKSNRVKNRFYSLFRKVRNKVRKSDFSIERPLDLLETYYILSLMEQHHHSQSAEVSDPASHKTKDFIFKLVQKVDPTALAVYKAELVSRHREFGTMSELFAKCAADHGLELDPAAVGPIRLETDFESPQQSEPISEPHLVLPPSASASGSIPASIPASLPNSSSAQLQLQPAPESDFASFAVGVGVGVCGEMEAGREEEKEQELPSVEMSPQIKITLPEPMHIEPKEGITREEKDLLWREAFHSHEQSMATLGRSPRSAPMPTVLSPIVPNFSGTAWGPGNEFGFSQSAESYELPLPSGGSFLAPNINIDPNHLRPVSYMSQLAPLPLRYL